VVAETILGVGMSLVSGADSAMLYDSLASAGASGRYTRYEGRITSFGNFAEAFAGIIGGLLAAYSLRTPYYFQAGIAFLAIPAALILREPPVHGNIRKPGLRDIFAIIRKVMHGDRKLFWNTIFSAVTGVSTLTMAWFAQPFFIRAGLQVTLFGVVWALLNLSVGIAAMYAWRAESSLGPRKTVILFTFFLLLGYFGLALGGIYMGFVFLLLFYFARGLATPTLRNYINIITTSDTRATVLSVRNFIIRGLFAVLGPLYGLVTDRYGLSEALLLAGLVFGILSIGSLFFFLKYRTYEA
jgi:MFS family permease